MTDLPGPEALAGLVSKVTQTMFGMSFTIAPATEPAPPWVASTPWRTVLLPIPGKRSITVAIASDQQGGAELGGAMFSCPPDSVDASMIDDSLSELANIVAGQVKSAIGLDQSLGLPRILGADESIDAEQPHWRSATLRGTEKEVRVWVAVTDAS